MKNFKTWLIENAPTNSASPAIGGSDGSANNGDSYTDANANDAANNQGQLNDLLTQHKKLHNLKSSKT